MTATTPALDEARIEQFAQQTMGRYVDGMLTLMIDVGHRTGLFTAAAAGPATSEQLAQRAGATIGGLLDVSFGNIAELVLALFVLSPDRSSARNCCSLEFLHWSAASGGRGKPSIRRT